MPRKRKLPPLPAEVFSVLGPLPVSAEPTLHEKEEALGFCDFHARRISIQTALDPMVAWQTLGHEMTHVALWDGGAHDALSEKQRELVCNALGTYLAAAVQAGYLKITHPRTRVPRSTA